MKILHVTPYFFGAWAYGGIPRLSFHLAAAQASLGHEVHAVTTDVMDRDRRLERGDYEQEGVKVRVLRNVSNRLAYDLQLFLPRGLASVRARVADYDVIHVHGHRNFLNSGVALAAARAGVPVVLQPNGTLVNIERRQLLKRLFDRVTGSRQVRATTGFIAVCDAELDQFESMGVPREKARVFPNGVDLDPDGQGMDFKARHTAGADYVLYLGKLTPRKGIEHAVLALAKVHDQALKLVIAGNDMGMESELRALAARQGLTDRVVFTGLVTGPEKAAAYRGALYTLYTGRDEIFGLVPWESILCGTPAIVADDCGCGEWIALADAGYVIPYADPDSIAAIIDRRDRELDEQMVERGVRFCRERLDWRVIARGMLDYYRELAR